MTDKRPAPRHTLAKNLKALIVASGMSPPAVAKLAGVDRKTINNQLNGRYDPRPEQVDKVASVFGLRNFNLLDPRLDLSRAKNGKLEELIALFEAADDKGRDSILQVAEMAARYRSK